MKVFVTKYALTFGIQEKEVKPTTVSENMVIESGHGLYNTFHKPFWHLTREEAQTHAEQMRVAKIASLQKSIAKLEKLTFKPSQNVTS